MDLDDWHRYIISVFPAVSPSAIRIERLAGGIVNSTVRVSVLGEKRVSDISRSTASDGGSSDSDSGLPPGLARGLDAVAEELDVSDVDAVSASASTTSRPNSDSPACPPPPPSFSLVLKHAPDHMPGEPETPLSQFRQTAEARALRHLHSDTLLADVLASTAVKVPRVVWHDQEHHVLWITDLGRMRTLTDFLDSDTQGSGATCSAADEAQLGERSPQHTTATPSAAPCIPCARLVGHRLGDTLARLHLAARSPSPALLERFQDPNPIGPGIPAYLSAMARRLLHEYGHVDADELASRVGLGISAPAEDALVVWSMVDLWPGSVLVNTCRHDAASRADTSALVGASTNAKDTSTPTSFDPTAPAPAPPRFSSASIDMALVDWEFAGAQHPGAEVGMMLAHLRGHAIKALLCPLESATVHHRESRQAEHEKYYNNGPDLDCSHSSNQDQKQNPVARSPSASASVSGAQVESKATEPIARRQPHPRGMHETQDIDDDVDVARACLAAHVAQSFVDGYRAAAPELVHSRSFPRELLQAYGREMVNGAELNSGQFSDTQKSRLVAEGAAALRAAGADDAHVDLAKITKTEGRIVHRILGSL